MIRPQLAADGRTVRLPIADRVEPLLDALAVAYAEAPDDLGALLVHHAENVAAVDHAIYGHDVPEYERAMRAATADGSREALLAEAAVAGLDDLLDPDSAISFADRITRLAAHIRHRTNRSPRP
ncbi:hypothetical protein CG747_12495 [Streptomyces sp. CB02959]|uniref:hypothetical protein n=1 Tax=Streptomyces sp. CB02959 TaxID=2020330 RepID=UPI000C27B897|nr:hypothetical protein [Streptomyces sp. CB02959]PJN40486.1 hypothetical protein CG747_12495 [Streptomyces sp. CB02959]